MNDKDSRRNNIISFPHGNSVLIGITDLIASDRILGSVEMGMDGESQGDETLMIGNIPTSGNIRMRGG
jgi:hypothetical protein